MTAVDELTKAGWQRLGDHSSYWKAPDDSGPSGKKWTVGPAYAEMLVRKASAPKPKPKTSSTGEKRKPGRPRKTAAPESDE